MVDDEGAEVHNGLNQGGRFIVLEVGDEGKIGAWQRADDHWVEIMPWTSNSAAHEDEAPNDLMVRLDGRSVSFLVNDSQVAQFATDLPGGRVGVFVGGDDNQVVLEHFTLSPTSPSAQPTVT